ncbi:hypothetical protein Tco_0974137 [Tanacetum coccineum]|uniref:Uncharacterized protein n=1 Tax=Tanacetum coccineum TaxID=301880 RepID=A0ABQ5EAQ6_9ASTR
MRLELVVTLNTGFYKEIFTLVAWIRDFNINEPIYAELCHEFYSTYEFDEVCADDELHSKKIIKFRLGGQTHTLTLLKFAHRLGLYQAVELEEDGFNVYFHGGLHSDDNFNATNYWLSISREENLSLSRSHTSTIKNPILRVIHKMITYGLYQRTTGYDKVKKNDLWLLIMFDARHQNGYANAAWVLTEDVVRSLSAPIYYRDLDTTTLRDLIYYDGSGYQQKDRKPSQNNKTEHGMEKTVQNQGQILFDTAALKELSLAVLTGTLPDFVKTTVRTKFLLGCG